MLNYVVLGTFCFTVVHSLLFPLAPIKKKFSKKVKNVLFP